MIKTTAAGLRKSKHRYSSDRPIRNSKQDLLGRVEFASRLAHDIRAWAGRDSLVIALYGSWGCGKTSLKNLLLSRLEKARSKMPIVEFNPWQFSGTGNIASAFFGELAIALKKPDLGAETSRRADKFERYAKRLTVGGTAVEKLGTALALFGVPGSGLVKVAGAGLKEAAVATQEGSDALRADAEEPSLSELKDDLSDSLATLKCPVLVVIDDIDRLSTEEIREVFQLVKANADFPNLIYLLLFERSIVTKALNAISGDRGAEFLEKIVQVGFHVPHASREEIQKVLFRRLDETLNLPGVSTRWEQDRWSSLYQECLAGYFQNLRHVYRYLASFDFHVRQFQRDGSFEVNPIDLIALEALRIFESDVYECLPSSKTILTRDKGRHLFGDIKQDTVDAGVAQILSHAPESRRDSVRRILELIFPPITRSYEGREGVSRNAQAWLREARACHPELFDKYFTWVVAQNDLSQAELERFVSMAKDAEAFVRECGALQERGLFKIAFERLDAFKTEIPLASMPSLTRALCDLCDGFGEPTPGFEFLPFDPLTTAFRMVYFGLLREKDKAKRLEIIRTAFEASDGVLLPVDIVTMEIRTQEREERGMNSCSMNLSFQPLRKSALRSFVERRKVGRCARTHVHQNSFSDGAH